MQVSKSRISMEGVFGLKPLSPNLYYSFESDFAPWRTMVVSRPERIDLVTMDTERNNECVRPIEIKLTALPDNQTANLTDDKYGSEIVVRSPSILHLALSIAKNYQTERAELRNQLERIYERKNINWEKFAEAKPHIESLAEIIDSILKMKMKQQSPFLLQPVWKTEKKTLHMADDCFDIFVWSDFAFTRLFMDKIKADRERISRRMRTVVWLSKMLYDYSLRGKIDYGQVIGTYIYDTKNDKAFALGGNLTNLYMSCNELTRPRISKYDLKKIILGGGEKFLSPERRLDAAILASLELFD